MRILAAAFVLALAAACMSTSAAESVAVMKDLMDKGQQVGRDVDDLIKRNRPQAALVVLTRHIREVDGMIDKVQDDPKIALEHKAELLKQLRGYRSDLKDSATKLRMLSDVQFELGDR